MASSSSAVPTTLNRALSSTTANSAARPPGAPTKAPVDGSSSRCSPENAIAMISRPMNRSNG